MSYVLGIDPGIHTGWAILNDLSYVSSGTFRVGSKYDAKSIKKIFEFLSRIKDQYGLTSVFVETQYVGSFMSTALRLAEVRGWWEACAALAGLSFVPISAPHWRRAVFGKLPRLTSKQLKQKSLEKVKELYNLEEIPVDEAEAILIARGGILNPPTLKEEKKIRRKHAKVSKKS